MRKILLCSLVCLLFLPVVAVADIIDSQGGLSITCSGTLSCPANSKSVVLYTPNDVANGGPWANPFANSSWISYAQTGISGTVPPNLGIMSVTTQVFNSGATGDLILWVLADDTAGVSLYQGSTLVADIYNLGPAMGSGDPYSTCSNQEIGCITGNEGVFDLLGYLTPSTNYTLVITDEQVNGSTMGLDYALTAVPEPASMLLLGSGLLALARVAKKKLC